MSNNDRFKLRNFRIAVAVVSLAFAAASLVILISLRSPGESILSAGLLALSSAVFSGAIAALLFSSLASRESERQTDVVLQRVLRETFLPLRNMADNQALSGYRYFTYLSSVATELLNSQYALQYVRVGYTRPSLPATVAVVCVASQADEGLEAFRDRDRYLLRWQVDDNLDPGDPSIFRVLSVTVDGRALRGTQSLKRVSDGSVLACEYQYKIPPITRAQQSCRVEVAIEATKELTQQMATTTVLFSNVTDAETSCIADSSLSVQRIYLNANASDLGPRGEGWRGDMFPGADGAQIAQVRFSSPIQAGASVTFYLDRQP